VERQEIVGGEEAVGRFGEVTRRRTAQRFSVKRFLDCVLPRHGVEGRGHSIFPPLDEVVEPVRIPTVEADVVADGGFQARLDLARELGVQSPGEREPHENVASPWLDPELRDPRACLILSGCERRSGE
jgi:hypothetical protein